MDLSKQRSLLNQQGATSSSAGASTSNSKIKSLFNTLSLKQLLTFVLNSSLVVKTFCVCFLLGYVLSFRKETAYFLSVIPGKLLPPNYYVWSLITHSFIEYRLFELFADWFIILLYSKMLEPLWGPYECVQFYLIITTVVALLSSLVYLIAFAFTFNELLLFEIRIHGLGGLLGGFSVATKQIMPDTILLNLSFLRLKQDHLPLLLVCFSTILYFLRLSDLSYLIMLCWGIFVGWVYLRFFQKHKNGTRGDSSSTFVFASFFPSQIQPFIAIVANTIFNMLVKLKICKQIPKRYNTSTSGHMSGGHSSHQSHVTITIPLVNSDNSDAERRRIKALKALKERLKKPDEEDVKSSWNDKSSTDANDANEIATSSTTIQLESQSLFNNNSNNNNVQASSISNGGMNDANGASNSLNSDNKNGDEKN